MTPNDRRSKRQAVELDVCLINPDGAYTRARASNISLDGLYLAPAHYPISLHSLVELSLWLAGRHYSIQAMVVHNSERGMGLMFSSMEEELYRLAVGLCPPRQYPHFAGSPAPFPTG
jgi:hypothetical protein